MVSMRIYFLLILTAITLSFSTAYFALNLEKSNFASKSEINAIVQMEKDFLDQERSEAILDLSSMYPTRDYFQLIQPISIYSKNETSGQKSYFSKACASTIERMSKLIFDKNEVWEDLKMRLLL